MRWLGQRRDAFLDNLLFLGFLALLAVVVTGGVALWAKVDDLPRSVIALMALVAFALMLEISIRISRLELIRSRRPRRDRKATLRLYARPVTSHYPPTPDDNWAHTVVENNGMPEEFAAEVIDGAHIDGPALTPYLVSWRDDPTADRRHVIKEAILNLASFSPPVATREAEVEKPPRPGLGTIGLTSAADARKEDFTFTRGTFRLHSRTQPSGFDVHGHNLLDALAMLGFGEPPNQLDNCDEYIDLKLRVSRASNGETVIAGVRLGFTRPEWNYKSHFWTMPAGTVEIGEWPMPRRPTPNREGSPRR